MTNLNEFGVLEMSSKEMQEVDGGIAPLVVYGIILVAGIAVGYWAAS